jgi:hypothetical protein
MYSFRLRSLFRSYRPCCALVAHLVQGVVPEHYFQLMMLALSSNLAIVYRELDLSFHSLALCASKRNVASHLFTRACFQGLRCVLIFRRVKRTHGLDLPYCGSSSLLNKHELNVSTGLDKFLKEIRECPQNSGVKQSKSVSHCRTLSLFSR